MYIHWASRVISSMLYSFHGMFAVLVPSGGHSNFIKIFNLRYRRKCPFITHPFITDHVHNRPVHNRPRS